jgi:ribose transport system permease protein
VTTAPPAEVEQPGPGAGIRRHARHLGLLRRLTLGRYTGVVVGLVVICVYLAITEPVFLTWDNWQNIFRSQAVVFTLGIGMTFVVLTGGIDLSIASATTGAAMLLGIVITHGADWWLACLAGIALGIGFGLVNGLLIGIARIPFFVVTLGTLSIYQSVALLSTNGETISLFTYPNFSTVERLINGNTGPFPTVLLIGAALYLIAAFVLRLTSFGRAVYGVGSNAEAARLTGIRVSRILIAVYTISGLTAGLAAIVQTGRLTAAGPQTDPNLMLNVIAAVLIGGTAFTGGDGGLLGTVIGVLFLGIVQNGLQLSDVSTFWQGTVSGLILILAVGLGVLREYGWRGGLRRLRLARAGSSAGTEARATTKRPS